MREERAENGAREALGLVSEVGSGPFMVEVATAKSRRLLPKPSFVKKPALFVGACILAIIIYAWFVGSQVGKSFQPDFPLSDVVEKYQKDSASLMRNLNLDCQSSSRCPFWAECKIQKTQWQSCEITGVRK